MQAQGRSQWPGMRCPPSPPAMSQSPPGSASGSAVGSATAPATSRNASARRPQSARHAQPRARRDSPPSSQVAPVTIPSQTLSPPTPAPSPTPTERRSYAPLDLGGDKDVVMDEVDDDQAPPRDALTMPNASKLMQQFQALPKSERFAFLSSLVGDLQLNEALIVSSKISPRLKRDFLSDLPVELALHCVSFIDDAQTLTRMARVCKYWNDLLQDECLWKVMHERQVYRPKLPSTGPNPPPTTAHATETQAQAKGSSLRDTTSPMWGRAGSSSRSVQRPQSSRERFRDAYLTESNWLRSGKLLAMHSSMGDSVVTSLVVNDDFIIIGMANAKIHVFDATTGHYCRSLLGHELGVWAIVLVTPRGRNKGLRRADEIQRRASFAGSTSGSSSVPYRPSSAAGDRRPSRTTRRMRSSDVCGSATSWGVKRTLVVSGGCDREVRVWDLVEGKCLYALRGHSSTIRCLKVLDGRPIAVSGSRDFTLRIWDIDRGRMLRVLEGHEQSVRCIEVAGNQVVSGSYDFTCRLWDIDTGDCLQVFEGHYHQIYAVAFDGERVVSGSLDSTVRVWDAGSGECLAVLPGHTSLVGQLQLSGDRLITGGSDGRVIVFDLTDYSTVHRLCAHDNSVTCLQFDDRFIVSGGSDGRVKLWDIRTGSFIRELTQPCDAVWRVCFRDDKCAILCQRNGRTVLEVLGFKPQDVAAQPMVNARAPDW